MLFPRFYNKITNQLGLSLVELLVGTAMLIIIMMPIASIIKISFHNYQYNMAQTRNVAGAREALNIIADELRYAKAVSVPAFQTGKATESARIDYSVSVNSADQPRSIYIIEEGNANALVIEHNGEIYKKVSAGAVSSIQFQRDKDDKKIISIIVDLNDHSYQKSPNETFNNTIIMLNM